MHIINSETDGSPQIYGSGSPIRAKSVRNSFTLSKVLAHCLIFWKDIMCVVATAGTTYVCTFYYLALLNLSLLFSSPYGNNAFLLPPLFSIFTLLLALFTPIYII